MSDGIKKNEPSSLVEKKASGKEGVKSSDAKQKKSETRRKETKKSTAKKRKTGNIFKKIFSKKMHNPKMVIVLAAAVAFIVLVLIFVNIGMSVYSKRHVSISVTSQLEKVVAINELQTVQYTYNSVAIKYDFNYSLDIYDKYRPLLPILKEWKKSIAGKESAWEELKANKGLPGGKKVEIPVDTAEEDGPSEELEADKELPESEVETPVDTATEDNSSNDNLWKKFNRNLSEIYELENDFFNDFTSYDKFLDILKFLDQSRSDAEKDLKRVRYAVLYNGTITAGIDEPIRFELDDENHNIVVTIPRVKILDLHVDIPYEQGYDSVIEIRGNSTKNDGWLKEAMILCKRDFENKINEDMEFMVIARQNARQTVGALIKPFEKSTEYTFIIVEEK